MTFISVLLPAPFSPMSACTSPWRSSRSTPSSAMVGPKDLWILFNARAIMLLMVVQSSRFSLRLDKQPEG